MSKTPYKTKDDLAVLILVWQNHVQALVREICGIGLGNKSIAPSMFTACMAIAACKNFKPFCLSVVEDWLANSRVVGHLFSRLQDQTAMLAILEQTEKDHARPTLEVQQQMKKAWRWR